ARSSRWSISSGDIGSKVLRTSPVAGLVVAIGTSHAPFRLPSRYPAAPPSTPAQPGRAGADLGERDRRRLRTGPAPPPPRAGRAARRGGPRRAAVPLPDRTVRARRVGRRGRVLRAVRVPHHGAAAGPAWRVPARVLPAAPAPA